MDVSQPGVAGTGRRLTWSWIALGAVVVVALVLRLRGIHNPILDHPGWRQGDTAAIARNFALLEYNLFRPQADYNGPPPHYVELELQIVPFLAATLYKLFGVHEIFGRLISVVFSLATVVTLAFFGRWLFGSALAGLCGALFFAIYPGSTFYGRTFTPDTTMVFFLTAAMFATTRYIVEAPRSSWRGFWPAVLLTAVAILAKPVAAVALVTFAAVSVAQLGWWRTIARPQTWAFTALALGPYVLYDHAIAAVAEWHWASGIVRLHVIPDLQTALGSGAAFVDKLRRLRVAGGMLTATMLGAGCAALFAASIVVPLRPRSYALLFGWLGAALAYAYVVVTVERVDYYLYLVLPLAALWTGGAAARLAALIPPAPIGRGVALTAGTAAVGLLAGQNLAATAPYYAYNAGVYRAAIALDATLDHDVLIVMGHYDPSVLYYINRKGWEEDPLLWTPFDQQSAIRKGARYFVSIEDNRLQRNVELYAWLQRFPVSSRAAKWPVYQTDYTKLLPGAEARWQEFRRREKAGDPRAIDAVIAPAVSNTTAPSPAPSR